jgi:glutathione S-transferase
LPVRPLAPRRISADEAAREFLVHQRTARLTADRAERSCALWAGAPLHAPEVVVVVVEEVADLDGLEDRVVAKLLDVIVGQRADSGGHGLGARPFTLRFGLRRDQLVPDVRVRNIGEPIRVGVGSLRARIVFGGALVWQNEYLPGSLRGRLVSPITEDANQRATSVTKAVGEAERAGSDGLPVLYHLKASHYNEKARWALDYKGVPHVREPVVPGGHQSRAQKLAGGKTFPVLVLDGEGFGDSSLIIEALERRFPDPALYPAAAEERQRALELEEFFDEELGPHIRMLCIQHLLGSPKTILATYLPDLTPYRRLKMRLTFSRLRDQLIEEFEIDDRNVALAFEKIHAAGERFRAELQPSGYLVGDRFSVADLTLAALLSQTVAPEQFPYPQAQRGHPRVAPIRDALAEEGLLQWTLDMYARHRGSSAEIAP